MIGVIVQKSIFLQPEKPPIDKIDSQESQFSRKMVRRRRWEMDIQKDRILHTAPYLPI
jgi:hypothetical protein